MNRWWCLLLFIGGGVCCCFVVVVLIVVLRWCLFLFSGGGVYCCLAVVAIIVVYWWYIVLFLLCLVCGGGFSYLVCCIVLCIVTNIFKSQKNIVEKVFLQLIPQLLKTFLQR